MSYGTVQAEKMTTESGYSLGAGNASSFKNRIINGGMTIDQRNAGALISSPTSGQYLVDRFWYRATNTAKANARQNYNSVTPPAGFVNYLGIVSSSAYSLLTTDRFNIAQNIEGLNVADLGWGAAGAATVTLSFQVYSSLTGTFGGALQNSAGDRSYPFTYTISSANTWTSISVTIAGDTSGTWLKTNGTGIAVYWGLGCGSSTSGTAGAWASAGYFSATGATSVVSTSGATFYITGVQFEVGTVATSFDYRPYGTELALCQRYFNMVANYNQNGGNAAIANSVMVASTDMRVIYNFPVQMRSAPSVVATNASQDFRIYNGSNFYLTTLAVDFSSKNGISMVSGGGLSGATQGQGGILFAQQGNAYFALNAEL